MSFAISAQGTTFSVDFDGGSPASFTLIPEVRSISGPSETADEIDVTNLDSTGGRRENIQGFKDGDDIAVEMNYVPGSTGGASATAQANFLAMYDSGIVGSYQIEYPDGATATADFWLRGRSRPVQVGEALVITATMRQTGPTTFVPSAP